MIVSHLWPLVEHLHCFCSGLRDGAQEMGGGVCEVVTVPSDAAKSHIITTIWNYAICVRIHILCVLLFCICNK